MSANDVYTVGNGENTQFAQRDDGIWFVRKKWKGQWAKWVEHGRSRPYNFGCYLAPRAGKARLPDVAI